MVSQFGPTEFRQSLKLEDGRSEDLPQHECSRQESVPVKSRIYYLPALGLDFSYGAAENPFPTGMSNPFRI
ncbi:MAG: hypothetical protein GWO10_09470 [candidate division Zixibacteria bacterium]|nr:hypothetical protein [candidate division Zixibacteria bacterium]